MEQSRFHRELQRLNMEFMEMALRREMKIANPQRQGPWSEQPELDDVDSFTSQLKNIKAHLDHLSASVRYDMAFPPRAPQQSIPRYPASSPELWNVVSDLNAMIMELQRRQDAMEERVGQLSPTILTPDCSVADANVQSVPSQKMDVEHRAPTSSQRRRHSFHLNHEEEPFVTNGPRDGDDNETREHDQIPVPGQPVDEIEGHDAFENYKRLHKLQEERLTQSALFDQEERAELSLATSKDFFYKSQRLMRALEDELNLLHKQLESKTAVAHRLRLLLDESQDYVHELEEASRMKIFNFANAVPKSETVKKAVLEHSQKRVKQLETRLERMMGLQKGDNMAKRVESLQNEYLLLKKMLYQQREGTYMMRDRAHVAEERVVRLTDELNSVRVELQIAQLQPERARQDADMPLGHSQEGSLARPELEQSRWQRLGETGHESADPHGCIVLTGSKVDQCVRSGRGYPLPDAYSRPASMTPCPQLAPVLNHQSQNSNVQSQSSQAQWYFEGKRARSPSESTVTIPAGDWTPPSES